MSNESHKKTNDKYFKLVIELENMGPEIDSLMRSGTSGQVSNMLANSANLERVVMKVMTLARNRIK